jgi:hypothetical protein
MFGRLHFVPWFSVSYLPAVRDPGKPSRRPLPLDRPGLGPLNRPRPDRR